MVFDGRTWKTIGKWARERGLSKDTLRRSLTTGGRVLGRVVKTDEHSNLQIRSVRGVDVLIRPINGQQWLYLATGDDAAARLGTTHGTTTSNSRESPSVARWRSKAKTA